LKAVILLSGGMDSAVILAIALEKKRQCLALSFDYGQRHRIELTHAKQIASHFNVEHRIISIDPAAFGNSSLIHSFCVPKDRELNEIASAGIPNTYVPARNTIFLSYAIGQAELIGAQEIYAGPNLLDQKPYPDCRPEFYQAFQTVINLATKQSIEGYPPQLLTPLLQMDKRAIAQEGRRLRVPFERTFSCYDPFEGKEPCQRCDACRIRQDALSIVP